MIQSVRPGFYTKGLVNILSQESRHNQSALPLPSSYRPLYRWRIHNHSQAVVAEWLLTTTTMQKGPGSTPEVGNHFFSGHDRHISPHRWLHWLFFGVQNHPFSLFVNFETIGILGGGNINACIRVSNPQLKLSSSGIKSCSTKEDATRNARVSPKPLSSRTAKEYSGRRQEKKKSPRVDAVNFATMTKQCIPHPVAAAVATND